MPVPTDPQLDGLVTTSLCGADPRADFRVAAVDTTQTPLLAVLLATDGYGNAQVVDEWPSAFSKDLAWLLKERDVNWLASQLPIVGREVRVSRRQCRRHHGGAADLAG